MPGLGLRNKNAATKQIDVNGIAIAEFTEAGTKMVKPLKANPSTAPDDVVVQSQVYGVGQSWQAPTRVQGTNYTNTTGKTIQVAVTVNGTGGSATFSATVSGVVVVRPRLVATDARVSATFDVPDQATYSVNVITGSINDWAELR